MPRKRTRTKSTQTENARLHYTDEERLKAVTILAQLGGLSQHSLKQVQIALNRKVKYSTLAKWQTELKPKIIESTPELAPQPLDVPKIIAETRQKLLVNLSAAAEKYSEHLLDETVIKSASARDSAVVTGISTEKMLLVAGRTPELDNLLQSFIKECEGTTFNPQSLLESLVNAVKAKKQALLAESSEIIDAEIITEQIS